MSYMKLKLFLLFSLTLLANVVKGEIDTCKVDLAYRRSAGGIIRMDRSIYYNSFCLNEEVLYDKIPELERFSVGLSDLAKEIPVIDRDEWNIYLVVTIKNAKKSSRLSSYFKKDFPLHKSTYTLMDNEPIFAITELSFNNKPFFPSEKPYEETRSKFIIHIKEWAILAFTECLKEKFRDTNLSIYNLVRIVDNYFNNNFKKFEEIEKPGAFPYPLGDLIDQLNKSIQHSVHNQGIEDLVQYLDKLEVYLFSRSENGAEVITLPIDNVQLMNRDGSSQNYYLTMSFENQPALKHRFSNSVYFPKADIKLHYFGQYGKGNSAYSFIESFRLIVILHKLLKNILNEKVLNYIEIDPEAGKDIKDLQDEIYRFLKDRKGTKAILVNKIIEALKVIQIDFLAEKTKKDKEREYDIFRVGKECDVERVLKICPAKFIK
jgi:hypothetical protein